MTAFGVFKVHFFNGVKSLKETAKLSLLTFCVVFAALNLGFAQYPTPAFPQYKSMYVDHKLPEIARIRMERAEENDRISAISLFKAWEDLALDCYQEKLYSFVVDTVYKGAEATGLYSGELYYVVGLSYLKLGDKASALSFLKKAADNGIEPAKSKWLELLE